jgi:hypothetical protein
MKIMPPSSRAKRLLAAALVCCAASGPVAASVVSISGSVSLLYAFDAGPPDGQNFLDSFNETSSVSSLSREAIYAYTSDPPQIIRTGQVDARAGIGSVGLSGSTTNAQNTPLFVEGDSYNTVQATGRATATFTDVVVTGPGSGTVSTRLRLHLSGSLSSTSGLSGEPDGMVGAAEMSFGITVNGSFVGFGTLSRSSTNGGPPQISASGLFAGFTGGGVVTTNTFLAPLNAPLTVKLELQMGLQSTMQGTAQGSASSNAGFYESLSFAADGQVFDLPGGYTVNSVAGGIVSNGYVAVPEPGVASLLTIAASAGLLRRRRAC